MKKNSVHTPWCKVIIWRKRRRCWLVKRSLFLRTTENQPNTSIHLCLMGQRPVNCGSTYVFHFCLLSLVLSTTCLEHFSVVPYFCLMDRIRVLSSMYLCSIKFIWTKYISMRALIWVWKSHPKYHSQWIWIIHIIRCHLCEFDHLYSGW